MLALLCLLVILHQISCFSEIISSRKSLDRLIQRLISIEQGENRPIAASCSRSATARSTLELMANWSNAKLDFTHIPKTAGTSATIDLKKIRPNKKMFRSMQKCYMDFHLKKAKSFFFLRNPTDHVYSQFAMCRDTEFGRNQTKNTLFPRTDDRFADYASFLKHFNALDSNQVGNKYDFNCMDPRDSMTRHLSCSRSFSLPLRFQGTHPANHAFTPAPDLAIAIDNIHTADFVGITYFYEESLCYLNYVVTNKMPAACYHDESFDSSSKGNQTFTHETFGVGHIERPELLDAGVADKVANLTIADNTVFRNGLLRFLCDIRFLEQSLVAERARFVKKNIVLLEESKVDNFEKHVQNLLQ